MQGFPAESAQAFSLEANPLSLFPRYCLTNPAITLEPDKAMAAVFQCVAF
jgi:hypothetical protein